ncbi:hypothetical protein HPB50_023137 [Hyalomma asiaticum]|uniref:Uncharacterized protein n=1 Tax=Hyalomma asiaticum TaxID=266040 RepID=A0ACB7T6J2_HYAAI|nr:hypothetical protein HPB50_023137 [Hyalomma asiaticum]
METSPFTSRQCSKKVPRLVTAAYAADTLFCQSTATRWKEWHTRKPSNCSVTPGELSQVVVLDTSVLETAPPSPAQSPTTATPLASLFTVTDQSSGWW